MIREFKKSLNVVKRILNGQEPWNRLFKKLDFFNAYTQFIKIDILTNPNPWDKQDEGWFETKIRKIVHHFEKLEKERWFSQVSVTIHPWPYGLDTEDSIYMKSLSYYYGLHIKKRQGEILSNSINIDFTEIVETLYEKILNLQDRPNDTIAVALVDLKVSIVKKENIKFDDKG